jgi:2-hydroxy-3-oxopropionate reductase
MADKIGFIGVGTMGEPMCRNLARKSGQDVLAADRDEAPLKRLAADGVKSASIDEIAAECRTIMLSLPGGKEVEQICLGEGGLASKAKLGWTVIDLSTSPISLARRLYAEFEGRASAFADAPVARTRQAAIDGTLSIMVGGDREAFDQVHDVLAAMGSSVVHVGDIGAGNTTKLANQVIVALNIAAVSEALVLAQKAGVAPGAVVEAIRGGLAGSAVLEAKAPMMLAHEFKPGFRINLHIKDLNNAMDTSEDIGAPLPLTTAVLDVLRLLDAEDHGGEDHSGLVQYYEALAGTRLESS